MNKSTSIILFTACTHDITEKLGKETPEGVDFYSVAIRADQIEAMMSGLYEKGGSPLKKKGCFVQLKSGEVHCITCTFEMAFASWREALQGPKGANDPCPKPTVNPSQQPPSSQN